MFCPNCGKEVSDQAVSCPSCGHPLAPKTGSSTVKIVSPKSRLAVVLLSFFLGWIGVHRFYVGKVGTGVLFVFFGWNVLALWVLIDFIMACAGSFTDKSGAFVTNWNA
jgi:TM2 domain-containing membrane protein YozV